MLGWIWLPSALTDDSIPDTLNEVVTPDMVKLHGCSLYPAIVIVYHSSNGTLSAYDTPLGWALVNKSCLTPGEVKHPNEFNVFKTIQTCNTHLKVVNVFPEEYF